MKISAKTIDQLVGIITGKSGMSPRRNQLQSIEFFRAFGNPYLSRLEDWFNTPYEQEMLRKFNDTEEMKEIIAAAFDFFESDRFDPKKSARAFNRQLTRDGYLLVVKPGEPWMEGKDREEGHPSFEVQPIGQPAVVPERLLEINHRAIREQISKVDDRLKREDYSGAITSSYTLIEQLLKLILEEAGVSFKKSKGSIRKLYNLVRDALDLNPAGENIESLFKPTLEGLQKIVSGLYETSNKVGDRHPEKYNPAEHHAKLVRNTAYTLCEFLLESRDYQKKLKNAPSPKTDVGREKT